MQKSIAEYFLLRGDELLLRIENVSKSFAGVQALKNINFELKSGEVHALMGENGAGKSTLMNILTGVHLRDSGQIFVDDKEVEYRNTREAQNDGVVIVHQELNYVGDLTVSENIFLGREKMRGSVIDDRANYEASKEIFEELGVHINPETKINNLSVGEAQMVEIAKAVSMDSRIIVFDEPTAALTEQEIKSLFRIINDLRKNGVGIIYISHRMEEIGKISDKITVMRDGQKVGTVDTAATSQDEIIKMMVGRELTDEVKIKSNVKEDAPVVLEVKNLNSGNLVKDVSFQLKKGEILGVSGLMGAGRTEMARTIFGADIKESGEIFIAGELVDIRNTADALEHGIGYVSEDRRKDGILVEKDIADNITISSLSKFIKNWFINDGAIEDEAEEYRNKLRIKSKDVHQKVANLSGGNQQKVSISKWLSKDSDIIILDEPTRGIDVGAKSEIYNLINELVDKGKSIIMISSELNEILRMSDRILVLSEGRKTAEVPIEEATQEVLLRYATMGSEL